MFGRFGMLVAALPNAVCPVDVKPPRPRWLCAVEPNAPKGPEGIVVPGPKAVGAVGKAPDAVEAD